MKIATIICYVFSVLGTLFLAFIWWIGGLSACAGKSEFDACWSTYNVFQWIFIVVGLLVPLGFFLGAMRARATSAIVVTALVVEIVAPIALFAILATSFARMY